jgi:multidrug efflux pump subunit AcrA (membrane-fusion protein)
MRLVKARRKGAAQTTRRLRRAAVVALPVVAAAMLVGCARPKHKANQPKPKERGVPVAAAAVERGTMVEAVPVTGTLKALREAAIDAQISARVKEVRVREGDGVSQGQVLVVLDDTTSAAQVRQARAAAAVASAQAEAARRRLQVLEMGARSEQRDIARSQLEQAEAALRNAQSNLERRQRLYENGGVSKEELDSAQTAYDSARTNRDAAKSNLDLTERGPRPEEIDAAREELRAAEAGLRQANAGLAAAEETLTYTVIRSPLSGAVYERNIQPGEIASTMAGAPLLRISDVKSIYYEATVAGRLAPQVHAGQAVAINVHGDGSHSLQGKVLSLVPVANPSSRDFLVRIAIPGLQGVSRPGIYADGSIIAQERKGVLVLSKDAIVERGGRPVVFVVENGKVKQREVQVGLTDRTRAEIVSGVALGDNVVVEGAQALKDGDTVTVQKAGPGAGGQ